jgi:ParB family chromosome partitioning protein
MTLHDPTTGAVELPVDAIAPDPCQPRSSIAREELAELARSLGVHRVIQAIVVTAHPEAAARSATPYMILIGERRWRAARLAGLATIPAVVRAGELSPADRLLLQLAENDDRAPLTLLERALAYRRACELSRLSQEDFARHCGKSRSLISQLLRLANAGGPLRAALEERLVSHIEVARSFEKLPAATQLRLLEAARREGRPITRWRLQEAVAETAAEPGEPRREAPREREAPPAVARRQEATAAVGRRAPPRPPRGDMVDIRLSLAQLQDLLRFLGAHPLASPRAAVEQLLGLIAAMGGGGEERNGRRPGWAPSRSRG